MERRIRDLRLAFIGVSHWHVPLYLRAVKSDGLCTVAVSDKNEVLVKRVAASLGCPAFTNEDELLDTVKPDFVFAFAPHYEMPTLAMKLLERRIPFAMEKPMGLCAWDVEHIKEQAEKTDVFVAVPFVWRYSELIRDYRERTAAQDIVHMAFRFVAGPPSRYLATSPWMLRTETAGGGCMTNLGVHFLDMAMFLTGSTDVEVLASAYQRQCGYDIECYASSLLRFGTGATMSLETGYAYPMEVAQRDNRWNIVTKNGYFTLEQDYFEERIYDKKTIRRVMSTDSDMYYPVFVRETLKQYLSGERPLAGLPEMLAVRRVLDKMNSLGARK